ncbi:aldehyde dehydrogenase family protein [Granulicella sp. S190]|uniref:aldehyde dehydrogenase family protein n=1 Tax=Granulicella sp. S190 TaxID=1747226 RepID=UPI0020B14E80|nr:aldehyde dehydrogenase family protein [Granulicella sp. S190]
MRAAIKGNTNPTAIGSPTSAHHRERYDADGLRIHLSETQTTWAATPVVERLKVIKATRHAIAERTDQFCTAVTSNLARNHADTLAAELLPLLAAARFLERQAAKILRARHLGRRGLPLWLGSIHSEVHRVPFGKILVIAPSNYPLYLPGVQVLQALAAGNSVIWKPGIGGAPIAQLFAYTMKEAGLPENLLRVTDESVDAAKNEIVEGVDKVFFTGSTNTGRALLHQLAETLTPCVIESSGCDAVVVLPSANLSQVIKALTFGMRLNGSATCMAPRRILLVNLEEKRRALLVSQLQQAFLDTPGITIPLNARQQLTALVEEAKALGGKVLGELHAERLQPILIVGANPSMEIANADIFAPVLMLLPVEGEGGVLAVQESCRFALTVSIFGDEREARALASKMIVGTVLINDLIVPTADPRIPFGGRRQSGFGVTQGAEGLLEMTAIKTLAVRKSANNSHYEPTTEMHQSLFTGTIRAAYGGKWRDRLHGLRQALATARKLKGQGDH